MTKDIVKIDIDSTKLMDLDLVDTPNQEMCKKVFSFFKSVPQGMTSFQITNFVLGDLEYPTPDSKYWQAKLELFVRLQGVISLHYDYRKKLAKIEIYKAKILECHANICEAKQDYKVMLAKARSELYNINIEECEYSLLNIQKTISDKVKEMNTFWNNMEALKPLLQYSIEDKDQQEEQFWNTKATYVPELLQRYPEVFNQRKNRSKLL